MKRLICCCALIGFDRHATEYCIERIPLGHPIGALSIPVGTRLCMQSVVCYTFCGRCRWKGAAPPAGQGLASGMRAGGFCGQVPRKHRALQEQKPPDREELGQECLQPCGRLPASTSRKRDTHPAAADHSHGSRASRVSFGSLSLSQPRRYAMAFPANTLVRMVSPSASRMVRAVPFSKSNTISPHSPSQSA